jgi:hypothetical protein
MPVTEPAMPTYTPQTLSAPTDMTMPAPSYDAPVSSAPPAMPQPALSTPTPGSDVSDLLDIKQQALQELTPLVGQLDQTPEEKFRTTMMLIQAADNADLLKEAHEAAQGITDEKVRAQALLDVINEINYFTQQQQHAEV